MGFPPPTGRRFSCRANGRQTRQRQPYRYPVRVPWRGSDWFAAISAAWTAVRSALAPGIRLPPRFALRTPVLFELSGRPARPRRPAGGLPVSAHVGSVAAYLAGRPDAPATLTPDARAAWRAHVDLAAVGPAAAALADAITHVTLAAVAAGPTALAALAADLPQIANGTDLDGLTARIGPLIAPDRAPLSADAIATMHTLIRWLDAYGVDGLAHPLAPLVYAWIEAQREAAAANLASPHSVLPHVHGRQYVLDGRGDLPMLPDFAASGRGPGLVPAADAAYLPGLEPASSLVRPPIPLVLYDLAGGMASNKGQGAPLAQRLFVEALLSLPDGRAFDGDAHLVRFTLRDLIAALWPGGWQRGRDLPKLTAAAVAVDGAWIELPPDGGRTRGDLWRPIAIRRLPTALNGVGTLDIRLPPGTRSGFLVHRATLRGYGARSAPAYRAILSLWALWDRAPTNPPGSPMIAAMWPVVKRDAAGYVLDAQGAVIVRKGQPVTSPFHPAAVGTGEHERNPSADRYPVLSDADLVALCYPRGAAGRATFRSLLRLSRVTLTTMKKDGDVGIERDAVDPRTGVRGWRLMPPGWYTALHATLGKSRRRADLPGR